MRIGAKMLAVSDFSVATIKVEPLAVCGLSRYRQNRSKTKMREEEEEEPDFGPSRRWMTSGMKMQLVGSHFSVATSENEQPAVDVPYHHG